MNADGVLSTMMTMASTMTSILFLGGIQLMSVGIIGEYIGRIYNETKARPAWVVARYRNLSDRDPSGLPAPLHESGVGD